MSKNSPNQNYECVKLYIQWLESKRKRQDKSPKKKQPPLKKYHPALNYEE